MSHATIMNDSYHTYEWVMPCISEYHITHTKESCHTYEWVMSRMDSHTTPNKWVMSSMNESCHTYEWVVSCIYESYHTHEWVMSRMNKSCHMYEWVMSCMNESYHALSHAHTNVFIHILYRNHTYIYTKYSHKSALQSLFVTFTHVYNTSSQKTALQSLLVTFHLIYIHYDVATIGRLPENIGLFCKRALQKRPMLCKRDLYFQGAYKT